MKVTYGREGLAKSWQEKFPETVKCIHCNGVARIAFVAHEGLEKDCDSHRVYYMHKNQKNRRWPHDCVAVAVYFCRKCLHPSVEANQA